MKTIHVSPDSKEVKALLDEAREEDVVVVRSPDGTEFLLTAVGPDDFDREVARTRQNEKLMALLDQRARQPATIPSEDVKRMPGLE